MPTHSFPGHTDTEAGPYNLFKLGDSFASWASRIALPQASSPNLGLYGRGVTVPSDGDWYVFRGDTQPTSWGDAVGVWSTPSLNTGSGDYSVTISIASGAVPVAGASVTVLSGASVVRNAYSDVDGDVVFLLPAGSYTINVTAFGFSDSVGTALTVDGNESVSISMTGGVIPTVPAVGLCTVRFIIRRPDGSTAIQNARVEAKLNPNTAIDSVLMTNVKNTGLTDSNGQVDLVLVRGNYIIKGSKYYSLKAWDTREEDEVEPILDICAMVPEQTFVYAEDLITE